MSEITPLPLTGLLEQYAEEHDHLKRMYPYSVEDAELIQPASLSPLGDGWRVLSPEDPNWDLIQRLWLLDDRLEEDMLRILAESPVPAALAIKGYSPWAGGDVWVEATQMENGTVMERVLLPEVSPATPQAAPRAVVRLDSLAGLCDAWCRWLDHRGFWGLGNEVGQLALDGWSVTVWCKYCQRCGRVEFHFPDEERQFRWLSRLLRFWTAAPTWRLRLAAWWSPLSARG
jgi:hypothetical protein